MLARYNAWANTRLYAIAAALPDELYRRDVGAYFKSLHGTLNHLLTADRIWLRRLTGSGQHPQRLDAIVFDDLSALTAARSSDDARLLEFVETRDAAAFDEMLSFSTINGTALQYPVRIVLAHVFNHQTHHRGQAHTILTMLGVAEPEPLDLLRMPRLAE